MSNFEYKTVALPRIVAKKRRRRQTEADLVAEQLGQTLNAEAVEGWEYVRAETLTTPGQRSLLKQGIPAAYVVLIFKRAREVVWQRQEKPAPQRAETPAAQTAPIPQAAPAPHPTPMAPAPAAQPTPPAAPGEVRFGTTSVQLVSSGDGSGSVTPMHPLGSAKD